MSRSDSRALVEHSLDELGRGLLDELLGEPDGPALSLYLSAGGPAATGTDIEAKNLLNRAFDDARTLGLRRPSATELTAIVDPIQRASQRSSPGSTLCVFRDGRRSDLFRIARPVEPLCVVGSSFHLTPLLVESTRRPAYVVALSLTAVRLLRCGPDDVVELPLDGVPRSLDEFTHLADREPHLQSHSSSRSGDSVIAAFHGQGSAADQRGKDAVRYIAAVTAGIDRVLRDQDEGPLVVAAVEEEAAELRHRSSHPLVAVETISGNPDRRTPAQLRDAAAPIVAGLDRQTEREQVARYHEAIGQNRAVSGPVAVHRAARDHLIDTILVARGTRAWAPVVDGEPATEPRSVPEAGDGDLVALALGAAIGSGARVVDIVDADLEDGVSAILRYPRS